MQHELFNLGSILATLPQDVHPKQPRITAAEVQQLEQEIDRANEDLQPLRSFVLPGGTVSTPNCMCAGQYAAGRNGCLSGWHTSKACPTEALQYLNRLSDALFVWSRWVNHALGASETLWEPNAAASGNESQ